MKSHPIDPPPFSCLKVLFVSHWYGKGGAEKSLLETMIILRDRGVQLSCAVNRCGSFTEALDRLGIRYHLIPYGWWINRREKPLWRRVFGEIRNLGMILPMAMLIAREKPDIVVTNTVTVNVGAIASRIIGKPHVWSVREYGFEDHGLSFDFGSGFSYWLIRRLSTIILCNSEATKRHYANFCSPAVFRVIYPVIDVPENTTADPSILARNDFFRLGLVGYLHEGKGQKEAIQAVRLALDNGVPAQLFIVGTGEAAFQEYLDGMAHELGIERNVVFTGALDNPYPVMNAFDVVLVCSRNEAFGRVAAEAMHLGRPLIAARSGALPELVHDGENGFLYDPGDAEDLSRQIIRLYKDPDLAKRLGEAGRIMARNRFTSDALAHRFLDVLVEASVRHKLARPE